MRASRSGSPPAGKTAVPPLGSPPPPGPDQSDWPSAATCPAPRAKSHWTSRKGRFVEPRGAGLPALWGTGRSQDPENLRAAPPASRDLALRAWRASGQRGGPRADLVSQGLPRLSFLICQTGLDLLTKWFSEKWKQALRYTKAVTTDSTGLSGNPATEKLLAWGE